MKRLFLHSTLGILTLLTFSSCGIDTKIKQLLHLEDEEAEMVDSTTYSSFDYTNENEVADIRQASQEEEQFSPTETDYSQPDGAKVAEVGGDKKIKKQVNAISVSTDYAVEEKSNTRSDARSTSEPDNKIYTVVETPASFPGGEAALVNFVNSHLKYPAIAQEQDIQGKVVLKFVVLKNGSVGQVQVIQSLESHCDQEAIRIVKSLPRFIPGKQMGKPVDSWFTLPIRFQLM